MALARRRFELAFRVADRGADDHVAAVSIERDEDAFASGKIGLPPLERDDFDALRRAFAENANDLTALAGHGDRAGV